MKIKNSIIDSIYYADIIPFNTEENSETDKLEKEFFESERIKPDSKLAAGISNFAMDYSCACRSYGFREGFICAARLMAEVFCNE